MIELVPIVRVFPSAYNPRKSDSRRLDLIELSLRKLGFLTPLFAHESGELLSGHQRHYVAQRMGCTHIPVYWVPQMDLATRKAVNILFNRGTNDLKRCDTPSSITEALQRIDLDSLTTALPDIEVTSDDFFPCLRLKRIPIAPFISKNSGRWDDYTRNMARVLSQYDVDLPVISKADYHVVNGLGRIQHAAEKKRDKIDVVFISDEQAALSDAMLNLLSMDFDIQTRYQDLLRYNSFRRSRRVGDELGRGFTFTVLPKQRSSYFDIRKRENQQHWICAHGKTILDFGAGHLHETQILREIGVDVTPFEPYRIAGTDEIDKVESIRLCSEFLEIIRTGKAFNSIFISSVLNSVPFASDRKAIVCIGAALCSEKTRLYACASSTNSANSGDVRGKGTLNRTHSRGLYFKLDYERNVNIGDFGDKPKVQKYHDSQEFYNLFKNYFRKVQVFHMFDTVHATCSEVDWTAVRRDLEAALRFEFELPYPDGSQMGLSEFALKAFAERMEK